MIEATESPLLGLSEKELKKYSVLRAINLMAEGRRVDGLEGEASAAVTQRTRQQPRGFFVPADIVCSTFKRAPYELRALNATSATAGGFTVATETASMIELLRNSMVVARLGARVLPGIIGNLAIPRQTGGATAYWLDEMGTVPESAQTFGQLVLTPHRLAAFTSYTKQLLTQTSGAIEPLVREDLMTVLGVEKDRACINGLGAAGEPLGVLNTTGINSLTFGGAPTWQDAVDFETLVESDNVPIDGSVAYLTSPTAKGKWKTTEKSSSTGVYLWQDNTVNGYPAASSSNVPDNRMIFGKWSDLIVADWDGIDLISDPVTNAHLGQVRVIVNTHTDNGLRHSPAFAASTDSAAQ